ncbi:MAG: hypothetical protein WCF84_00745 [Anaerolineae bacterium]
MKRSALIISLVSALFIFLFLFTFVLNGISPIYAAPGFSVLMGKTPESWDPPGARTATPLPTDTPTNTPTPTPTPVLLSTPSLSSPPDGAPFNTATPILAWSASSGATSYNVRVMLGSPVGPIVFFDGSTATTATTTTLPRGQTYYWQVQPCIASGCGVWTDPWSFTLTP